MKLPLAAGFALCVSFAAVLPAGALEEGEGVPVTFNGVAISGDHEGSQSASGPILYESAPSDPVETEFDAVLLDGNLPDPGVSFEVSRREPGGPWSPWVRAELHRYPNGRFWCKAVFPSPAKGRLQVRVLNAGSKGAQTFLFYTLEAFLDPKRGASAVKEEAAAAGPSVIARSEWGAKPPKQDYTPHSPKRLTLHNTAGNRPTTLEEAKQEMRFIQDYHQNGRGWNDIGYHFLIDAGGRIFQGRPAGVLGAHVADKNTDNVGISLMGFYHPPRNDEVGEAQLQAVRDLGRWLNKTYGISPENLFGHRDLGDSDCPGDNVYKLMKQIRDSLREAASALLSPDSRGPLERAGTAASSAPRLFDGR